MPLPAGTEGEDRPGHIPGSAPPGPAAGGGGSRNGDADDGGPFSQAAPPVAFSPGPAAPGLSIPGALGI